MLIIKLDEKEKELNKWFLDNLKTKVLNKSEAKEKQKIYFQKKLSKNM